MNRKNDHGYKLVSLTVLHCLSINLYLQVVLDRIMLPFFIYSFLFMVIRKKISHLTYFVNFTFFYGSL